MLAPHTEARTPASFAALCVEALGCYDDFVARLRHETTHPFEYARCGTVEVALDEAHAAKLRLEAKDLARLPGVEARWLDASEATTEEPPLTEETLGAIVVGTHGFVAVSAFVAAMLAAAQRRGAIVESGIAATSVAPAPDGIHVRTSKDDYIAGAVVVCAGCWSGQISIGGEALPVYPVRGQLLHLRPRVPLSTRILWGPRCYLVPWADGTLLAGATVEDAGFDERTTVDGVRTLGAAAIELVPALRDAELVGARVGLRPATRDGLPMIGSWRDDRRLIVATGHYRNGVLLAPITASMVADLLIDGRPHPLLADFTPDRFTRSLTTPGGGS
jgi:glycine oxidase